MSTKIGCDNLVYAKMTTEDSVSGPPEYGTVTAAPGVMSININPNGAQETLFADDGPMETASTLGKIEVEIQKNELTPQILADLLGHKTDTNGVLVYGDSDVPPWVAIGFRTLKSSGNYRYVWLLKGKFTEPEDQNETKGDSINFQAATISGQFVKLTYQYTVSGSKVRPWKTELDAEHTSNPNLAKVVNAWFKDPVLPGATYT